MSPVAKVWNGSAWVQAPVSGKVLTGSYDFTFAPPGGSPTYESLSWPSAPTVTDSVDGSTYYAMGAEFNLSAGFHRDCLGIEWNPAPSNTPNPGSPTVSHYAQLFQQSDGAKLAEKSFTPTPGVKNEIFFDTPAPLLGYGEESYYAIIYTWHYVFRFPPGGSGTWEVTSPSGMIHHVNSRLQDMNAPASSASGWGTFNSWYYISPIVAL